MKKQQPFIFDDFRQAYDGLLSSLEQKQRYALLTGESGSGKTTILRVTHSQLDRCRYRWVYFNIAQLTPGGLVRLLARTLRIPACRSQPETLHVITRTLAEEPARLVIAIDEAQRLPDDTLVELYTFAEANLETDVPVCIILSGLPRLRDRLQAPNLFPLWRRLTCRLDITGLRRDEVAAFVKHHIGLKDSKRFEADAITTLAEHGRGLPGLILPYVQHALRQIPDGTIGAELLEALLQQWELP